VQPYTIERRSGVDRRQLTLSAFFHGARNPRRRIGRRSTDRYPVIDLHSPRVLALVVSILVLCVLDGVFTLALIANGARELNPVMALFVPHNPFGFAVAKLALTGIGVCVLVACSRMRLFRGVPGEAFLYAALAAYVTLICYQLRLLAEIPVPIV
jgi:hypothetical protein